MSYADVVAVIMVVYVVALAVFSVVLSTAYQRLFRKVYNRSPGWKDLLD